MTIKLVLIAIAMCIVACPKSEPKVDFCTVNADGLLHCFPSEKKKPEYTRDIKAGDMCVTPDHFAELKKHHNALHERLNE